MINNPTDVVELLLEQNHVTYIFPATTDLICTLEAHASADTWSTWAEVEDSDQTPNKLSDLNGSQVLHISSFTVEWCSDTDKRYHIELAYGASYLPVAPLRLTSGDKNFLPPIQQMRIRTAGIPIGELIYYRLMCEAGGATCRVSFRYHYHD